MQEYIHLHNLVERGQCAASDAGCHGWRALLENMNLPKKKKKDAKELKPSNAACNLKLLWINFDGG